MSTSITYAEYKEKALAALQHYFKDDPDYIQALDERGCIRRSYKEDEMTTALLGSNQFSPSGFAYGCHMLYPDFPDGDEAEPEKPVFDFKFNPVHKD